MTNTPVKVIRVEALQTAISAAEDVTLKAQVKVDEVTSVLADNAQSVLLIEQAAGIGRVANEAALAGKPAGAYELVSSAERLLWDGNAIVAGSRSPMLLVAGLTSLPTPAGATGDGAKFEINTEKSVFRVEIIEPNGLPTDDQREYMRGRNPADAQWQGPMTVGFGRANLIPAVYGIANGHNNSAYGVASFAGGAGSATGNPDDPNNASGAGRGYCSVGYGKNVLAYGTKGSAFGEETKMFARAGAVSGYWSQAGDEDGSDIGSQAHGFRARATGMLGGAGGGAWGANICARNGSFVYGSGKDEANPYVTPDNFYGNVSVFRGAVVVAAKLQSDFVIVWNGYGTDKPSQKHDLHIKAGEAVAITLTEGAIGSGRILLQGLKADGSGDILQLGAIEFTNGNGASAVSELRFFTSNGGLNATPALTLKSDGTFNFNGTHATNIVNTDGTAAGTAYTLNTLLAELRTRGILQP